jgi:hypothetical protein
MTRSRLLAPALAAALAAPPAARATCCVFTDPLLAVHDVAGREGGTRLSLETARASLGHAAMDAEGARLDVARTTFTLRAVHSPRERVVILAALPVVEQESRVGGGGLPALRGTATVPGDGDVEVRLALWREVAFLPDPELFAVVRARALAIALGAGLPTGAKGLRLGGERLAPMDQPGSGALEPHAGLMFRQERGDWGLHGEAMARAPLEAGGYRRGASAMLSGRAHRRLGRFALGLGLDARAMAADRQGGAAVPDTGGAVLVATPGVDGLISGGLWAALRVDVPVAARWRGDQRLGPAVVLSVHYELLR